MGRGSREVRREVGREVGSNIAVRSCHSRCHMGKTGKKKVREKVHHPRIQTNGKVDLACTCFRKALGAKAGRLVKAGMEEP